MQRTIYFTTILLLLLTKVTYSIQPRESLKTKIIEVEQIYNRKQDSVLSRQVIKLNSIFKKREDSLQKELQIYKLKDSFYSDKYAGLASVYSAVMAIIAAIITAIGIGIFFKRINDVKTELEGKLTDTIKKSKELEFTTTVTYLHFLSYQASVSKEKTIELIRKQEMVSAIEEAAFAIKTFCNTYSLGKELDELNMQEVVSQERIDSEVKALIKRAQIGCINLKKRFVEGEKIINNNRRSYSSRLKNIIDDLELDNLIAANTSPIVRQLFYTFKSELTSLIKELYTDKK